MICPMLQLLYSMRHYPKYESSLFHQRRRWQLLRPKEIQEDERIRAAARHHAIQTSHAPVLWAGTRVLFRSTSSCARRPTPDYDICITGRKGGSPVFVHSVGGRRFATL